MAGGKYSAEFSVEQGARMQTPRGRKMWNTIYKMLTTKVITSSWGSRGVQLPGEEVWEEYFGMYKTGSAQEKADHTLIEKYLLENETYNPDYVNKWMDCLSGNCGGIAQAYFDAHSKYIGPVIATSYCLKAADAKVFEASESKRRETEFLDKFKQNIRSDTVEGIRLASEWDKSSNKKDLQERYKCNPLTTDAFYSAGYD